MERRKSRRNADNTIESVDRISALPDSILGVILSLLPTKNALATSALSKRWEFLWRTVHTLDFCFDADGYAPRPTDKEENEKFARFVNHVLLHHDAGVLNKFRLLWIPTLSPATSSHATSWIKTAITRNVHELSVSMFNRFPLPLSVFSCDSLRSLKLEGFIELSAATVFSLPRLESLDLYGVTFRSDETFEKMIRGCPVLSYLHIFIDDDVDEFSFIISSTSLRRLELELGRYKSLKLKASSLEHLKLYGKNISVNFLQKKLTSLVEANFGILYHPDNEDFSQAGIYNSVVDAVSALDCVKILTLSEEVMRALSCATINLSADFKRLVKLETRTCCCACSSLQGFIQRSNNLQLLTVHKSPRYKDNGDYHDHSIWTAPTDVPICFSNSLKKVVVYGYRGLEDERAMIRYMFEHGSALEAVQISSNEDTSSEEECNQGL